MTIPIRTLGLSLLLVTGVAQAGLFSRKAKPAPPPPPAPAPYVAPAPPPPPPAPIPMEFSGIQTAAPSPAPLDRLNSASPEVRSVAQWVGSSHDNGGLPFVVVDKENARAYAFNRYGQLEATAPVLLGMTRGDKMLVSNDAPMSAMPPDKRITPSGRYVSYLVTDSHGKQVLAIDAAAAISMHIVVKGTPAQRRAERLASVTSDDNRVSFGCINVPPGFFTQFVSPDFTPARGIVYVLPETRSAAEQFGFQPAVIAPPSVPQALVTAAANLAAPTAAPQVESSPMAAPAPSQAPPIAPQPSPLSGDGGSADPSTGAK
jgi:hypothetical protein